MRFRRSHLIETQGTHVLQKKKKKIAILLFSVGSDQKHKLVWGTSQVHGPEASVWYSTGDIEKKKKTRKILPSAASNGTVL